MKFVKLAKFVNNVKIFSSTNNHTILAGIAIVGVIGTAYASMKAGLKADEILKTYKEDMKRCNEENKEEVKEVRKEFVKDIVPVMIPPVVLTGLSIGCIIGSHKASTRKLAALAAAYSLSEEKLKGLSGKMEEVLGEKKTRAIKEAVIKDKFEKDNTQPNNSNVIVTGNGDVLCKDMYNSIYFYSNAQKIERAILSCSRAAVSQMFVSLNELYGELGIEETKYGDEVGWSIDDLMDGRLPITLTALLTDEGNPCVCMDYIVTPKDGVVGFF